MGAIARCPGCGAGIPVVAGADRLDCAECDEGYPVLSHDAPPSRMAGRKVIVLPDAKEAPFPIAPGAGVVAGGFLVAALVQVWFAIGGSPWGWLGALVSLGVAGLAGGLGLHHGRLAARRHRVLREGAPGEATVKKAEIGEMDGEHEGRLELFVEVAGRATRDVVVEDKIPAMLADVIREGVELPVRVDPEDQEFVVVEWDTAAGRVVRG